MAKIVHLLTLLSKEQIEALENKTGIIGNKTQMLRKVIEHILECEHIGDILSALRSFEEMSNGKKQHVQTIILRDQIALLHKKTESSDNKNALIAACAHFLFCGHTKDSDMWTKKLEDVINKRKKE